MSSPTVNNTQEPSQHQQDHHPDNNDVIEMPQPPPPLSPLAILVSRSRSFMTTGRSSSFLGGGGGGGDVEASITSPKEYDNGDDNRTVDSRASQDYDDVEQQQGEEVDITVSPTKGSNNIVPAGMKNNKNGRCKFMLVLGLLVVTICLGVGLGVGLTKVSRTTTTSTSAADTATSSSTSSSSSNGTSQDSQEDVSPKFFPTNATSWPELLGMDGEEAKATLEEAYPGKYDIYIIPVNSPVTMDLRWDRVRIFVDPVTGIVVSIPWVA